MASLARAVLPTVAGAIWAQTWDLGWPWQPHCVYLLLAILNCAAIFTAQKLPLTLNTPRGQLRTFGKEP
eukprot:SAG31_NODE_4266_length_3393_cov_4.735883_2_plen_69_part_00